MKTHTGNGVLALPLTSALDGGGGSGQGHASTASTL